MHFLGQLNAYCFSCRDERAIRRQISSLRAQHVIELAQSGVRNPTALFRLTVKKFKKRSGEGFDGHSNAAAFVSSAKVLICWCDRHNSDVRGGIVLGFSPHQESGLGLRSRRLLLFVGPLRQIPTHVAKLSGSLD